MKFGACSNIGKVRKDNEDSYYTPGDNGRAIGKSQSHIGELEQQLNDPNMNRKDKEKIRNKIDRIRKTAQKKKKGENHSNGNKR